MNNIGGRPGWAWIFILEGLLTVIVATIAFWVLADSPKTATFLTEGEAKEVEARLRNDNDELAEHYDIKFMWQAFADYKIWMQSMLVISRKARSMIEANIGLELTLASLLPCTPFRYSCHLSLPLWASLPLHLNFSPLYVSIIPHSYSIH